MNIWAFGCVVSGLIILCNLLAVNIWLLQIWDTVEDEHLFEKLYQRIVSQLQADYCEASSWSVVEGA